MNFPNILTIIRILLIPFFIFLLISNQNLFALIIFLVAICTDALDGFIARTKKMKTSIGSFLDPMADKLLLLPSFIILAILKKISLWVMIAVVTRDVVVILGWVYSCLFIGNPKIVPSTIGKIAAILQMVSVFLILLNTPDPIKSTVIISMVFFTILSGVHYIISGLKNLIPGES